MIRRHNPQRASSLLRSLLPDANPALPGLSLLEHGKADDSSSQDTDDDDVV